MANVLQGALQSLKKQPLNLNSGNISASSAQLNPVQFQSPLPPNRDLLKQAVRLINREPFGESQAQNITPTPTPIASHNQFGFRSDMDAAIQKAFPQDPQTASAIGMQESSLNPQARYTDKNNNIDAIGLLQVNLPAHLEKVPGKTYEEKAQNLMNPDINLQVARKIYDQQGWQPWQAYTTGEYKRYLGK